VTDTAWCISARCATLVAGSIAVSRISEEGADTETLAWTLMHPPAGPEPGPPADSIL
jgi:hypothetical protein